jgi:hypothetical protein
MAAVAKPKDKEEKRAEREQRKAEKAVEKFERKQNRADDRVERRVENVEPRIAPLETFNPRVVEQSRVVAPPQIQPEFDAGRGHGSAAERVLPPPPRAEQLLVVLR